MVPEVEKPRATEIQVRIDCNGCVQKIKKALHGILGIYDVYIDFSEQKITIIGWADPKRIIKAIKKSRKTATICSHQEQSDQQAQQQEPPPEGGAPPPEHENPPPVEAAANDPPDNAAGQPPQDHKPADEEVHVVYQYPTDYGNRYAYMYGYAGGHGFRGESMIPAYMPHNYYTYMQSPYVTEYPYIRPPPWYSRYSNEKITSMFSEENPNACTIV